MIVSMNALNFIKKNLSRINDLVLTYLSEGVSSTLGHGVDPRRVSVITLEWSEIMVRC